MPEYDEDDDDQIQDDQQTPNWRRRLEADAKAGREAVAKAAEAEARAVAAERKAALAQLGIDESSGPGKLFAKAYDGENTVEAMRTAAEEYGVLTPAQQQVSAEEQQAMQRIQNASAGGQPGGGAAHDFQAELDAIPEIVNGQYNPDYVNAVMAATQVQAAREGRNFATSGGAMKFAHGAGPVTTPLNG
jgi:hypothetical protein